MEHFLHMDNLRVEIQIHNHYQHQEYEQLRLSEDFKKRLETHLLKPWVETIGEEESKMVVEITPKEHQVGHMDYKVVQEISPTDQKEDSDGIKQTSMGSQGFLDQTLETMMSLETGDEKQGVGYLGQFQVQDLELQVTMKIQDELHIMTLQYQMMKRNGEVNAVV